MKERWRVSAGRDYLYIKLLAGWFMASPPKYPKWGSLLTQAVEETIRMIGKKSLEYTTFT